jgi:hypothetical protein
MAPYSDLRGCLQALWQRLSTLALEAQQLEIAERCYAALGDVARTRFLHKVRTVEGLRAFKNIKCQNNDTRRWANLRAFFARREAFEVGILRFFVKQGDRSEPPEPSEFARCYTPRACCSALNISTDGRFESLTG